MSRFRALSPSAARSFIAAGIVRRGPHRMSERILHWLYCANCGLVNLRNPATREALLRECAWVDD